MSTDGGGRAAHLIVRGRVQGVGFRHFVVLAARRLEVEGWVRNLADGAVEIWAEGGAAALDELERTIRRGPPSSSIRGVERLEASPSGRHRGFEVRWDGE